jgi:hypothetical protein
LAHPAAVIPIAKRWGKYVSVTGLVLGSMAPDFEYFVHFKPLQTVGHSFWGCITYNFPLVLLVSFLFHHVLKKQMIDHLPHPLDSWYAQIAGQRWRIASVKEFVVFFYSSLIGMLTHVLWDHFTHLNGYFVQEFVWLQQNLTFLSLKLPFYKLAQHGSTLIGFIVLGSFCYRCRRTDERRPAIRSARQKWLYWSGVGIGGIALALFRGLPLSDHGSVAAYGELIVSLMSCTFINLTIVSWIVRKKRV